jgi:hypothetical protein
LILNSEQKVNQNRRTIQFKTREPVKVNQKWLFSGSSLEIIYHFWVRNQKFQPNISVFSFQFKTQVWLLNNIVLASYYWEIWIQFWSFFTSQQLQALKLDFKPKKNCRFQTRKQPLLVYFNRPTVKTLKDLSLSFMNDPLGAKNKSKMAATERILKWLFPFALLMGSTKSLPDVIKIGKTYCFWSMLNTPNILQSST